MFFFLLGSFNTKKKGIKNNFVMYKIGYVDERTKEQRNSF